MEQSKQSEKDKRTEQERESVLRHLASMPGLGHCAVTREVLRSVLLSTDGVLLLAGGIFDIVSKHLGAGIYSVTTKARK